MGILIFFEGDAREWQLGGKNKNGGVDEMRCAVSGDGGREEKG